MLGEYQQERILILIDPSVDPDGIGVRYHAVRSLRSLTGGGWSGQGLYEGIRTQNGELPSQHTDFIFSAIGEEMGYVGCVLVLVLLVLLLMQSDVQAQIKVVVAVALLLTVKALLRLAAMAVLVL